MITVNKRITELVEQHGSLRAAAVALGCDPGYLSRLSHGEKTEPSDDLLRRLGLRRVVTYERWTPVATPLQPRTKSG